jgi:hypothetical protein
MKFELGEFVRFVDENREGYITKIFSDEMVGVTGEDDFEIPVMTNNLTRVHGKSKKSGENQNNIPQQQNADFIEKGIFLGVVSDKNKGSVVYFHLVNQTSYQLLITLKTDLKGNFKGEFSGVINPQSETKIYSASLPELDIWPSFQLQALYYTTQNKAPIKPIIFDVKFRAKDFAGSKTQIPIIKEQGWLIRIDEPELKIDAEKLKESFFKPSEEIKTVEKPAKEIDLHIEKLRTDYHFLNKNEILEIQMAQFETSLDAAIVHQFESIVFIHGSGNGTLQHHIHKAVSKHPKVKTFKDAQKEKFGYGATEVFLK